MPKITIRITGLRQILGRDYTIEELCWEPSLHEQLYTSLKQETIRVPD